MTPEQKIITIAEFEGWRIYDDQKASDEGWLFESPKGKPSDILPPYLTSRDAICGAVARLNSMKFCYFVENLERVCKTDGWEIMGSDDRRSMLLATPAQLADALLLTLGHEI